MTITARARMASAVLPVTLGPVLNGRAHGAIPSGSSGGRSRERSGGDVRFIWRFMDVAIWCMVGQGHGGCGSDHKAHHGQPVAFVLEEVEGSPSLAWMITSHAKPQSTSPTPMRTTPTARRRLATATPSATAWASATPPSAPRWSQGPGPGRHRRRMRSRRRLRRVPAGPRTLLAACAWPAQWFQRRLGALVSFPSGIADVIPADRRTADGLLALTTPAGSRTPGSFASPGGKDGVSTDWLATPSCLEAVSQPLGGENR